MAKILALMLIVIVQTAHADVMLQFKDKTAHVWDSYYEKAGQYCTMKSFGEFCVQKKDVVSIKNVPPGTEASEYGVSSMGPAAQDYDDRLKALHSLNCTQLRASTSDTAKEHYRNECMTRAEQDAWDEQQKRKAASLKEEREKQRAEEAEAARKKQAEIDRKQREDAQQRRSRL